MVPVFLRSFLILSLGGVLAFPSWSQPVAASPEYILSIQADGMPVNPDISIPITTRTITLKAQLTPQSIQAYPLLEPTVLIREGYINFIRNNRRYSMMLWEGNELPFVGFVNIAQAQAGDRCALEIRDARTRTKAGVTRKFPRNKTILLTLHAL